MQQYRLGLKICSAVNVLEVLIDNRLKVNQNYDLEAKKASNILRCAGKSIASRSEEMILPISTNEATIRALGPMLGSPVQERNTN